MTDPARPWDGAIVRTWLESRIASARADQVAAERRGREAHDDCDKANAEELVCTQFRGKAIVDDQKAFAAALKDLLDRDDHVARGVYDDDRFARHVRSYLRKLIKMTRDNAGFENTRRYQ